jgi:ADP-ribose pyrophosphatase
VPDDKINWSVSWPEYATEVVNKYTAPVVVSKPVWADPEETSGIKWNEIDNKIDRRSHHGKYSIENGYPKNPVGRTGLSMRGLLGKLEIIIILII